MYVFLDICPSSPFIIGPVAKREAAKAKDCAKENLTKAKADLSEAKSFLASLRNEESVSRLLIRFLLVDTNFYL